MAINYSVDADGVFNSEIKNRFRSVVNINGNNEICYVESSSRLDNYIDLKNKIVKLQKINGKKLKYRVTLLPYKKDYILLCPMMANKIIISELSRKLLSNLGKRSLYQSEAVIENYKTDIYFPKSKTLIEIKAVLSLKKEVEFPTVFSDRTIKQLLEIEGMLEKGYKSHFVFVALNPYIDTIRINKDSRFYSQLKKCIDKGLKIDAFSITCKDNLIKLKKRITIEY